MGGLIGINETWFRYRAIPSSHDLNDMTKTGLYILSESGGYGNKPSGFSDGFLVVFDGIQLCMDYSRKTYMRIKWGSNRSSWGQISLT